MTIDVGTLKPMGERILVKAYVKPEVVGSLILPQSALEDRSWSLWEVVKAARGAEEALGVELGEGDILKTKVAAPTDAGFEDERDGRRLFFTIAEMVQRVIPCTWGSE